MGACERLVLDDEDFGGELVVAEEECQAFFAPVRYDLIDTLLQEFGVKKARIESLAALMADSSGLQGVVRYFADGNRSDGDGWVGVDRLFCLDGAMLALTAEYWSKALSLTDVMEYMPQKRRDVWHSQMTAWKDRGYKKGKNPEMDLPEFSENSVRPTLMFLLNSRAQFFAEKVDGIFRALSGDHVTNCPEAFGKRMIISHIHDGMCTDHRRTGYIADLRAVVAKFMGREGQPTQYDTSKLVSLCMENTGEWHVLDGGAMRLRVYKVGTAHLELNDFMANRLNGVLASIYPGAIPPKFRKKNAKKSKVFGELSCPLPFAVISILQDARKNPREPNKVELRYRSANERGAEWKGAADVLEGLGGCVDDRLSNVFYFDYDPWLAIGQIRVSGCVPDDKSHQFYPTPEAVVDQAVIMADIGENDDVLEPSAGLGAIAVKLPNKKRVKCVELSELRCKVLESRGFNVECEDFIAWSNKTRERFDRVVMNPPFADGRAILHTKAAAELLKPCGILVAVLPASAKNKEIIPGWACEWSDIIENAFDGTGVNVVIMKAVKPL